MTKLTCWICEDYNECPFEICRTQAELAKEWDKFVSVICTEFEKH